jgi:hypothetical protein
MRTALLQEIQRFAESKRPAWELESWCEKHAREVESELGRSAYLAVSKRKFVGLKHVLEEEGLAYVASREHCQSCGEPFFVVAPGTTTKEQIISFAKQCSLKEAAQIIESGWMHPGQYCKSGCTFRLWNIR